MEILGLLLCPLNMLWAGEKAPPAAPLMMPYVNIRQVFASGVGCHRAECSAILQAAGPSSQILDGVGVALVAMAAKSGPRRSAKRDGN